MKLLPGTLIALVLLSPCLVRAAAPAGCGEVLDTLDTYLARAEQAQARRDYGQAADALWSAWCRTGEFSYLVRICQAHVQSQDRAKGLEILRYAERRARSQSESDREALRQCREQLQPGTQAARPAAPAAKPAPTPLAKPAPAAGQAAEDTVLVTILTEPPETKVYIDNQLHGLLGTPLSIRVPTGMHQVRLVRSGYNTRVLNVHFGSQRVLSFTLEPSN